MTRQRGTSQRNLKQVVRSMLDARIEHKRADVFFAVNSAAAGAVTPLTQGITQGDDISQRSGDRIILEKISIYITSLNIRLINLPSTLRVIVFEDKLNTGSVPAVTDVLSSADYTDGYNVLNLQSSRFKVLKDAFIVTVSGQTNHAVTNEWHFKVRDHIQYNGGTNVAGANGRGALFMLFIDGGAFATYRVGVNLTYSDA